MRVKLPLLCWTAPSRLSKRLAVNRLLHTNEECYCTNPDYDRFCDLCVEICGETIDCYITGAKFRDSEFREYRKIAKARAKAENRK